MRIVEGCLLEAFEKQEIRAIAHQVNCKKVMGAGIAKTIRKKYPEHYNDYLSSDQKLGNYVLTEYYSDEVQSQIIFGLFAQDGLGGNKRQTNYTAFIVSLWNVVQECLCEGIVQLGLPFGIGCGLANGKWTTIIGILKEMEEMYEIEFVVYRLKDDRV